MTGRPALLSIPRQRWPVGTPGTMPTGARPVTVQPVPGHVRAETVVVAARPATVQTPTVRAAMVGRADDPDGRPGEGGAGGVGGRGRRRWSEPAR